MSSEHGHTDGVDIAAVTGGGKAAWDGFVEKFAGRIFSVCLRVMRMRDPSAEPEDARDATQDVFLKLVRDDFRLLRSYDPARASLATWLTVVARSTTLDALRRPDNRRVSVPLEEDLGLEAPQHAHADTPELPLELLSPRQRQILHMLFDQDMDVEEIAVALNVHRQTVRSLKHQALERLRQHLRAYGA